MGFSVPVRLNFYIESGPFSNLAEEQMQVDRMYWDQN